NTPHMLRSRGTFRNRLLRRKHVCTDHGSGYPAPGSPSATGSGVGNRVRPSSSRGGRTPCCNLRHATSAIPITGTVVTIVSRVTVSLVLHANAGTRDIATV